MPVVYYKTDNKKENVAFVIMGNYFHILIKKGGISSTSIEIARTIIKGENKRCGNQLNFSTELPNIIITE